MMVFGLGKSLVINALTFGQGETGTRSNIRFPLGNKLFDGIYWRLVADFYLLFNSIDSRARFEMC